ncbi:putative DNA binding domain-containing protein [Candidatus Sumerlaeota bacterium]|nr:putative DNA binding domain-containing protein [Candidatus Sumerlaeota bacterium]
MPFTIEDVEKWKLEKEARQIEFKEAKESFDGRKLVRYCAALANEKGGLLVLGMGPKLPRTIVGTRAFLDPSDIERIVRDRLHFRVECSEVRHTQGRVLVISVPPRPIGQPVCWDGQYLMRSGESLVPMTPDMLRRIFQEGISDFSAQVHPVASISDLDPEAILRFREMAMRKSGDTRLGNLSNEQILNDAELIIDGQATIAALVLLGSHRVLGRHLPHSEVVFEYRSSDASIRYQDRKEYRAGFLLFHNDLWEQIDKRNALEHYQDGFLVRDIPAFREQVIREAVLNAVCHRDYGNPGNVWVRQYPMKIEIESPGGFVPGVTPENILNMSSPRNRRIADALARCGLVERSGQGMNLIYESCIKEGKPLPDFTGTDDFRVCLTLRGEIRDPRFLKFIEEVGKETLASFDAWDFVALDLVYNGEPLNDSAKSRLAKLTDLGIVERVGRGRGSKCVLSRRFHSFLKETGKYTRRRGLDRETNKQLLLKHIQESGEKGSPFAELSQVLPALSRGEIHSLLRELRGSGSIHVCGARRAARWYTGPSSVTGKTGQ